MSTHGAVGISIDNFNWTGKYVHYDCYPSGVGKTLFDAVQGPFRGNLQGLVNILMSSKTGWSEIDQRDWSLSPIAYTSFQDNRFADYNEYLVYRNAQPNAPIMDYEDSADVSNLDLWGYYAYIFNVKQQTMTIYTPYNKTIAILDLTAPAPDWEALNEGVLRFNVGMIYQPEGKD